MNEQWAVAAAAVATAALMALAPIDELDFLLQFFGAGLAAGMFIAYRAVMRNPRRDPFPIQARWAAVGIAVALVIMLMEGVLL